ncbi:MAG: polymer-forming cytoskeletal protein [Bacteroidota bacterium]
MFGNKSNETSSRPSSSSSKGNDKTWNNIAAGTVVVGNINAEGDMRIEGKVIGTLVCNSKLVVSGTGYIEGSVDARNATIEGEIKGNVITRELLQLDKSSKVYGDIFTQKLVVQMGAIFTGSCKMGEAAQEILKRKPQGANDLLSKNQNKNQNNRPNNQNTGNKPGMPNQKVNRAG